MLEQATTISSQAVAAAWQEAIDLRRIDFLAAAWTHARSIAATADVGYTRALMIQVNAIRPITPTLVTPTAHNKRLCQQSKLAILC